MLKPLTYSLFSPRELTPTGWLYRQLRQEADSLVGNLDRIWPDIRDSMWIGGTKNDWERVPYWLDGFIPLAFLLDDEDLKNRAAFYINGILDRQCDDGWMPPTNDRYHYDTWANLLLAKVLTVWCDATGDTRAEEALYRSLKQFSQHIDGTTLHNWGAARWFEGLIPIFWLYERRPESWLLLLAKKLDVQGIDWTRVLASGMLDELNTSWDFLSHVVNIAMMLKCRALMSRITGEDPDAFAKEALRYLREKHGMATGHFTGDENLSGNSPIQGSELCSVVEAMYSYETLFTVSGDPFWLDALEKLAYNALPAAFSADMWTHQYVQLTNQVECARTPTRVFRTNNEEAHIFGLEPHYGCCTANMGQGFPKLALHSILKAKDGVLFALPLPNTLSSVIDGTEITFRCESEYPFRRGVRYRVKCQTPKTLSISFYIPTGLQNPTLNKRAVTSGEIVTLTETISDKTFSLDFDFVTRFEERPDGMLALWRGVLLYSLPIDCRREMREYERDGVVRKFPYCDYYLYPESDWNYGFSSTDPSAIVLKELPYRLPFDPDAPPITLTVPMAKIPWQKPDGRCQKAPDSLKPIAHSENKIMIPYGATYLRMTEMPKTK